MAIRLQLIIIVLSLVVLFFMGSKIREQHFGVNIFLPWLGTFSGIILLALFPSLIEYIAALLGAQDAMNAIFFIAILFLVFNLLSLSFMVSELRGRTTRLTQEVALLRHALQQKEEAPDEEA